MCASGVVCSMKEGQECRVGAIWTPVWKTGSMLRFVTDELHEVLSSVRLSQLNSDTDGCQECSQVNSSRKEKETVAGCSNGLAANLRIVKPVQRLDRCLNRNADCTEESSSDVDIIGSNEVFFCI